MLLFLSNIQLSFSQIWSTISITETPCEEIEKLNLYILTSFSGVMECIMFETEDLVCRKNEKHVILTLLEVARRGAKLGMLAPMLVQFEQEIDREIAR